MITNFTFDPKKRVVEVTSTNTLTEKDVSFVLDSVDRPESAPIEIYSLWVAPEIIKTYIHV